MKVPFRMKDPPEFIHLYPDPSARANHEQKPCQVGAVLAGAAGDEDAFGGPEGHGVKTRLRLRVRPLAACSNLECREIIYGEGGTGSGLNGPIADYCTSVLWQFLCPPNPGGELLPYPLQSLEAYFPDGSHQ